jgi:hypothetical protein
MNKANRELDARWAAIQERLAAVSNPCSTDAPACAPAAESGQTEYARSQTACRGLWWPKP